MSSSNEETLELQNRYRIYHLSYLDFIAAKGEVAEERVDGRKARERIAGVLWEEVFGEKRSETDLDESD